MYSLEDRMKAVSLYFKYGGSSATVRRELGYPSRKSLRLWVREYKATGVLHEGYSGARKPKYSNEQKQVAVDYYLEHGRSLRGTIRELGYPHRETLKQWLDEALPYPCRTNMPHSASVYVVPSSWPRADTVTGGFML